MYFVEIFHLFFSHRLKFFPEMADLVRMILRDQFTVFLFDVVRGCGAVKTQYTGVMLFVVPDDG